jgi:hypothetical protein
MMIELETKMTPSGVFTRNKHEMTFSGDENGVYCGLANLFCKGPKSKYFML